jgi:L-ascorbate 6-phosphate lactonase
MKKQSINTGWLEMKEILDLKLKNNQAALWFLGQAGYIMRADGATVVIDPYLSDSVAKVTPDFARAIPVPLKPSELQADIYIVTHDHLDHLDPETIRGYRHKNDTVFVAPRLACEKLLSLGISGANIRRIDSGETDIFYGVKITGIHAIPTDNTVIDTTGYKIEFKNGRSVYHSSDTSYSETLLSSIPRAEVFLLCINGKWGNLTPAQAAEVAAKGSPLYAIPNHYDLMKKNSENPETFKYLLNKNSRKISVKILKIMEPFVW